MSEQRPVSHIITFVLALAIVGGTWVWYFPHIEDDALISARYALRLAEGHGLSWNDGYFVEGYSNLAWVLATTGLIKLGLDPVLALRLLGAGVTLAVVLSVILRGLAVSRPDNLGLAAVLVAATLHGPIITALGGLEAPLVLATVYFGGLWLLRWWESQKNRDLWIASVFFAVLCVTRPDGPLFAAIAPMAILLKRPDLQEFVKRSFALLILPVAAVVAQLAFRKITYDAWVPNTARIKLTTGADRFSEGMDYILDAAFANSMFLIPFAILFLMQPRRFPLVMVCFLAMAAAWSLYIASVGGDFFYGYRHFLPVLALAFVLLPFAINASEGLELTTPTALVAGVALFSSQFLITFNQKVEHTKWIQRCHVLADTLVDKFGDQEPTMAITAAGCLPLWTGFESIDLLGLNDLEIPDLPTTGGESFIVGHRIGNLDYLLRRAPDIVVFNTGSKPDFAYKDQVAKDPRFYETYCEATLPIPPYTLPSIIYLHREFLSRLDREWECADTK